jgi:TolA-binding protein
MRNASSAGEVNITNARYTLGYSNMRQENYADALKYFEQITTRVSTSSSTIEQDAFLRSADCYYMQKKYSKALQMYQTILDNNLQGSDYALYQKAMIAGAQDQFSQKISLLQSLSQRYPSSSLLTDANMEIANTYLASENYDAAVAPLNNILKAKNADAFKPQAYLKLGIAYYNLKKTDDAINDFKKLVATYPNSQESSDAISYVRSIFISTQQPGEFIDFMHANGKDVSVSEEDSLTYTAANLAYSNNPNDAALNSLQSYLKKFPGGYYAIDANFQAADILYKKQALAQALPYYTAVADKAPNKYAEPATLLAARINYFEVKDYNTAEKYYSQLKTIATSADNKLESMRGLLRCQYKLQQWTDASANAQDLLQQKGLSTDDKMIANMVIAKSYQMNNQLSEASAAYKSVIALGKSEYAAEARYHIAEILLQQQKLPEAEKAGFDVINKAGSYDYWITKAYILLGDVYMQEKDYFNAEATLKSVVQNTSITELKTEAQQKLDAATQAKEQNSKVDQGQ